MMMNVRARSALKDARVMLASIPIFAQQLCGEKGVTVEFDRYAPTAMTDGSKITLPALPLPEHDSEIEVCEQLADMVKVFIPHEVGHIRFSDFSEIKKMRSDLGRSLLNAIEDPRMELEMIRILPGTRRQMDVGLDRLQAMGWFEPLTTAANPAELLTIYVLYHLRGHLRGQDNMLDLAEASRASVVEVFGLNFVDRLEVLLDTYGMKMRSTKDARDLANLILEVVKDEKKSHDKKTKDAQDQKTEPEKSIKDESASGGDAVDSKDKSDDLGNGSGSAGESKDEGSQQDGTGGGSSDGGKPGERGKSNDTGQSNMDSSQGNGKGSGAGTGNPFTQAIEDGKNGCKDLGELLSDAIGKQVEETDRKGVNNRVTDLVRDAGAESSSMAPETGPFDPADGLLAARALKTRLRSHLQTNTLARTHDSVRGSRISPRKLHRTGQYDRRLFVHQDDQKGIETVVYLLADVSGSMSNEGRIDVLRPSLYAVADAMNSISGVKVGAGIFPWFRTVIPIGSDPRRSLVRMNLSTGGGTPMATALSWAGRQLAARKEPRKILMILTDGEPSHCSIGAVIGTTEALEAMGIEVFAVGMQTTSVASLFDKHCVIDDMQTMPAKMIEMLKDSLMKPQKRAA